MLMLRVEQCTPPPDEPADGGGGGGGGAVDLEPSARPRGDDSDGSSTSSLEEQEFADMERLMEELDAAAMAGS